MQMQKKKWIVRGGGLVTGLLNGLLGAGGGMLAVPILSASGLDSKKAHVTSIAVILPLSAFSAAVYLWNGRVTLMDAVPYLPGGLMGALLGAWLMPRLPAVWLHRIFGVFILWAAWRVMFQ